MSMLQGEETLAADVIRFTVKPSQMVRPCSRNHCHSVEPLQPRFTFFTLWSLQLQDDFRSAAKALTEAVAQKEDDNMEICFATAADTDFLAYVYATVSTARPNRS
jgi:hypothetical protein